MNRRTIINMVLLAAVVVLAALAYFEPGRQKPAAQPPLSPVPADQIARLRIEQPQQPALVLAREDGEWRILEPYAAAADANTLQALLDLLAEPVAAHYPLREQDPAAFGLDQPGMTLHINDGAATLSFGDRESLHNRYYVKAGETIHLLDALTYYRLSQHINTLLQPPAANGEKD